MPKTENVSPIAASSGYEQAAGADAAPEVKEVQANKDAEDAKGYVGTVPDPTPNENYTVAGVVKGLPTPETDPGLADEARRVRAGMVGG